MPNLGPLDVTAPNTAPDLLSQPDAAHGPRDWYVLEAVRSRLAETDAFDDVYLSALPSGHGRTAGETRIAVVEPIDWDEIDESDDPTDVQETVRLRFRVTILVRDEDPATRDDTVDRLLNVAKNAINGQPLVPGQTIPPWTRLRKGTWQRAVTPERRMVVTGETAYWVDGTDAHDETE